MKKRPAQIQPVVPYAIERVLTESLLPLGRTRGLEQFVLAQTPMSHAVLPGAMKLLSVRPGSGRNRRGAALQGLSAQWPESGQVALQFPYFCFVFDGEADIIIDDAVLACPAGYGVAIPPGTPITDGRTPHWERPGGENAHSDIFWMLLRPFGAECHICHTRGNKHSGGGFGERALISNRQIFHLGELLIDEMTQRRPGYEEVAGAYWSAMLRLLQRHWEMGEALPHQAMANSDSEPELAFGDPEQTVQRARRYIEEHLGQPLSLQEIAQAAFVSRAHLARLFPEKTGSTVWQYVTERRLEEAKSLLLHTDISIYNIARLVGFPHVSHFCTRFAQLTGHSPGDFRLQGQGQGQGQGTGSTETSSAGAA